MPAGVSSNRHHLTDFNLYAELALQQQSIQTALQSRIIIMANFRRNVNKPEDEVLSPGAVLRVKFTISEKVLLTLLGLSLSFTSGFTYGQSREALAATQQPEPSPVCQQ